MVPIKFEAAVVTLTDKNSDGEVWERTLDGVLDRMEIVDGVAIITLRVTIPEIGADRKEGRYAKRETDWALSEHSYGC